MSPGTDGLRSCVGLQRKDWFAATITLHDGRDSGVVRQGLALRRRSLYDQLWAIATCDYTSPRDTVLRVPKCAGAANGYNDVGQYLDLFSQQSGMADSVGQKQRLELPHYGLGGMTMRVRTRYLILWVTVGAISGIAVGALLNVSVLAGLMIGGAIGAVYQISLYGL